MAQNYRPQLDGIRAFCIIFTIVNHVPGKPDYIDGTVGVDVFFALSGWLITWLLLEERRSAGAIDLKAFYIRRFFRIVPLYYFTIVVYAAAAVLFFLATASSAKIQELREAIAYLVTFNSEYRSSEAGTVFGHAWTLGIEEKVYVVWPALMVIFRKWVFGSVVCAIAAQGASNGCAIVPWLALRCALWRACMLA
jgi:peptidoglycan/LPS O-acetylase OafA/YrhL